jgi:hypothetical protein
MNKTIIWNQQGDILHQCDSVEEAEELIKECQYEEVYRDTKNGDTNIAVIDF